MKTNQVLTCECKDNVSKDKYVCTIIAVLISLCMNLRINAFHGLMVFTIIVLRNAQETFCKEQQFQKQALDYCNLKHFLCNQRCLAKLTD